MLHLGSRAFSARARDPQEPGSGSYTIRGLGRRRLPESQVAGRENRLSFALAISPIAFAFVLGWAAKASGILKAEHWAGIEMLSFRLLIPAILIHAIASADLDPAKIGPLATALLTTVAVAGLAALALRLIWPRERVSNAALSTLFQTSTRWNAFIALSAADLLGGPEVLLLIAVSMAVLIPMINIGNILVLTWLCSGSSSPTRIFRTIATNPLVIGCAIGLVLNAFPALQPEPLMAAFEIVGRAALGVGLLVVGAGISLRRLSKFSAVVVAGTLIRPIAVPGVFFAIGSVIGLQAPELLAGLLVTAVPAASNGYVVAKAMGGDADLYADILVWQTFLAMIAIPVYAMLVL